MGPENGFGASDASRSRAARFAPTDEVCSGLAARAVDDLVSLIDLAPTYLEMAGLEIPKEMVGRSLLSLLKSDKLGQVDTARDRVFAGRERHSSARPKNLGYPSRCLRTNGCAQPSSLPVHSLAACETIKNATPRCESRRNTRSSGSKATETSPSCVNARRNSIELCVSSMYPCLSSSWVTSLTSIAVRKAPS